jgi:ribosome maturation factor RimP
MTHPLIPEILNLATPIATTLNLEVVHAVFQTHQNPPILRIDIRNPNRDTSLEDCEAMSRALEVALDAVDLIPGGYTLEISSPGIPKTLSTDRELASFQGFPITVFLNDPNDPSKGTQEKQGQLIRRDETHLYLTQKGRLVKIPRPEIIKIELADP